MTINQFAKSRSYLFWSTRNFAGLNEEVIVETILNYGDWEDVQELIKILDIKEVAKIFNKQISYQRTNYYPQVKNYFKLYFDRYA